MPLKLGRCQSRPARGRTDGPLRCPQRAGETTPQLPASVIVVVSLGNRVLFERLKCALEFADHQLEPLADCGIDHCRSAFCGGNLGKEHVDVRHGFHKCGALAPRNRSTNQKAPIATKERTKIPPHARKVGAKLVVITSSAPRLSASPKGSHRQRSDRTKFAPPAPNVVVNFAHNARNIVAVAIGTFPRRAHADVAFLLAGQDHRHRLGMDRFNDCIRRCRQKAVDQMRPGDRLRLGTGSLVCVLVARVRAGRGVARTAPACYIANIIPNW